MKVFKSKIVNTINRTIFFFFNKGGSKFGIGCYDGTHSFLPCNFVPLPKRKRMAFILLKGGEKKKEHIIN